MKKHIGLAAGLAALVLAAPASAAPTKEQVQATCNGEEVTINVSGGSSFWIGDSHYVLKSFSGTFTPAGGGPVETFTKTFGQKRGLTQTIRCTGSESSPFGTFTFDVTGVKVGPRKG
jgi:hypothetical protein